MLRPSTDVLDPEIRYHNIISVSRFELEVSSANSSNPASRLRESRRGRNVGKIVGGTVGGFVAVLGILVLWFLRYRSRRMMVGGRGYRNNRTDVVVRPFSPGVAPSMMQSHRGGVGVGVGFGSARVSFVVPGGKRHGIARHVVPADFWGMERPQRSRYEVDAGPVNLEGRGPGEIMPPQYEQVYRDQARSEETRGGSSRGAEVHENEV